MFLFTKLIGKLTELLQNIQYLHLHISVIIHKILGKLEGFNLSIYASFWHNVLFHFKLCC